MSIQERNGGTLIICRKVSVFLESPLYLFEITGSKDGLMLPDVNIDGTSANYNESYWQTSDYLDYGYWAALKRMGKAQEVTGCFDYELLMPIPSMDIMLNPDMTQNPGY